MGLSSWQVYIEMHHLSGTSVGEDALDDEGEGGWRAGVNLQRNLVQVKHSRVEG